MARLLLTLAGCTVATVLGMSASVAAPALAAPPAPEPPPLAAGAKGAGANAQKVIPAPGAPDSAPGPGGTGAAGSGQAGSRGVVVRLDAGAQKVDSPVVVHMKPDDGPVSDVQLKDDGAPPDVNQGDGTWSGTLWSMHDAFTVTLSLGKTNIEGGKISWAADELQRDLSLTLLDGQLKAEAGVAAGVAGQPPTPPGEGASGGDPATGGTSGGSPSGTPQPAGAGGFQLDKPPGGGGGTGTAAPFASTGSDATLYFVFGVAGLALAIIFHLWRRGGRRALGPEGLPAGMTVVPEAGLLGQGTPALNEGLSQWVVPPNDAHDLLRPLLATLARYHRVVVCAPTRSALPAVPGGPVYRVAPGKPADLGDAVEALQDIAPGTIAVLILGDGLDGAALKAHGDALPEGVGGAVVVMQVLMATLPVVHCERRGDAWRLKFSNFEVDAVARLDGFERQG
ncbi:MAG: hypothetical protein EXR69_08330 [Myxococcales bacterium]|nr:hypothetical protein [Myxococcales bacterium]